MIDQPDAEGSPTSSYDEIARDLQQLRFATGDVPYAEIVRRIAAHRESSGIDPGACRPARTTVYDAFRAGRRRVNPQLIGEIARVLGASDSEVLGWEERCLHARRNPQVVAELIPDIEKDEVPATPKRDEGGPAVRAKLRKFILFFACIALNTSGFALVAWIGLPLYFDMVGTAIAAILLGPWVGVAVGLSTNGVGMAVTGSSSIAFALVNIVGALVWGYGARRFQMCRTMPRYLLLNVLVALSCSLVASALLIFMFNGGTGHASESTTRNLAQMGNPMSFAVLISNVVHSLADKLLTGFVVLGAFGAVRRWIEVPFYDTLSTNAMRRLKSVGELEADMPPPRANGR